MSKIDTSLLKRLVEAGKIKPATFNKALKQIESGEQKAINVDKLTTKELNKTVQKGAVPIDVDRIDVQANLERGSVSEPDTFLQRMLNRYGDVGNDDVKKAAEIAKKSGQPYANVSGTFNNIPSFGNDAFEITKPMQEIGSPRIQGTFYTSSVDPLPWMDQKHGVTKNALLKAKEKNIPVVINTSSDLIGHDDYIAALPAGSKVRIFGLSGNPEIDKLAFPGNPSNLRLQKAFEKLKGSGVDVEFIPAKKEDYLQGFRETQQSKGNTNALKFGDQSSEQELAAQLDDWMKSPEKREQDLAVGIKPFSVVKGAASAPAFTDPLELIRPAVDAYETGKQIASQKLAEQLNLTKDPTFTSELQGATDMVMDPANLLPGVGAAGVMAVEGMTNMKPRVSQEQLQGLYKGGLISGQTMKRYAEGGLVTPTEQAPPASLDPMSDMTAIETITDPLSAPMMRPGPNVGPMIDAEKVIPPSPEENLVEVIPGSMSQEAQFEKQAFDDSSLRGFEQAIALGMQAGAAEGAATASFLDTQADQIRKQQERDAIIAAENRQKLDEQANKIKDTIAEYGAMKVNPDRLFQNMSTGKKIGLAISVFFAGVNGSKAGVQIVENAINRDIEAQRAMIAMGKEKVAGERLILSDMMARFGDERQAAQAAKVAGFELAELKLKSQLARLQGTKAYADGMRGLAELSLKKQEAMQKFKDATLTSGAFRSNADLLNKIMRVPDDKLRSKLLEEKANYDKVQGAEQNISKLMQQYGKKLTIAGQVMSPRETALTKRLAAASMMPFARQIAGPGVFNEADFERILAPFLPAVTDTENMVKIKTRNFIDAIGGQALGTYQNLVDMGFVRPPATIKESAPVLGGKK